MIDRDICMICHAPQGACVHTKQAWVASDPRANPAEPDQDASSDDSDHPETAFLREGAGSGEITARTRQLIQRLGPRRRGGSAGSFGDHSAARPGSASPRSLASPDGTHSGEGGASQSEANAFSDSEAEEAAMRGGKVSTSPTPSAGQFWGGQLADQGSDVDGRCSEQYCRIPRVHVRVWTREEGAHCGQQQ